MNKYLKAFLSCGGVFVLAFIFLLLGWGFFVGLGTGLALWFISAILTRTEKKEG